MTENGEAYLLAGIGAAEGVWNYYIKPELKAGRMWCAIGATVLTYELICPKGELLSEGVDRAIEDHPIIVPLAIGITALHLMNKLPERIDPFHRFIDLIKRESP
jgi:hypothetical protein